MAKAWHVPGLKQNPRFDDAAGRIIITRWREMMSYAPGTIAGEDIEELHAMRVSSRRLRAAMDAFAAAFPASGFRKRLRVIKEVTDTLGAARDLDVAMEGLTALLSEMSPSERIGIEALIGEYREQRAAESVHIAALLTRLEEEGFGPRFERWVGRATGVDAEGLHTGPPDH
jgi:CHAD domain-containing protein